MAVHLIIVCKYWVIRMHCMPQYPVVVRWTSSKTYSKSTSPISCTIRNSHLHGVLMLRESATGAAAPGEYPVSMII